MDGNREPEKTCCVGPTTQGGRWVDRVFFRDDTRAPEVDQGVVSDVPGMAVAVSGGGMRSFACACGQVRALCDLGMWDDVKYLSASSGGAWFALTLYCAEGDVKTLVGAIKSPAELELKSLGGRGDRIRTAAATAVGGDVIRKLVREFYVFRRNSFETALEEVVEEALFRPFPGRRFTNLRQDRPFVLVGAAVLGPWALAPFPETHRQYRCFEVSPLAFGAPKILTIDYGGKKKLVGGFFPTETFGTTANVAKDGTKLLLQDDYRRTATTIAAVAGAAHADFVSSHHTRFAPVMTALRTYSAPLRSLVVQDDENSHHKVETFIVGDGGIIDNLNLLPLVRRRNVDTILALCNFETPVNIDQWNPFERGPIYDEETGSSDLDPTIASYFGINVVPDSDDVGYFLAKNHCFDNSDGAFSCLVARLQRCAKTSGCGGGFAALDVETVENKWYGVEAGRKIRLLVSYLGKSDKWSSLLADDSLKAELRTDRFENFPHLAASGPFAPPFDHASVDLLASFSGWNLKTHLTTYFNDDPVPARTIFSPQKKVDKTKWGAYVPRPQEDFRLWQRDVKGVADSSSSQEDRGATTEDTLQQHRLVRRSSSIRKLDALIDGR